MIPILYAPKTTNFNNNGLGALIDTMECRVVEERNGIFEMEMTYPINGRHYADISLSSLIKVETCTNGNPQLFRVYKITKPLSGKVHIFCEHISYELSQIPVLPFELTNVSADTVFQHLKANSTVDCPFDFRTDKDVVLEKFSITSPLSLRSALGGAEGSMLDRFKGEYEWDNFTVGLYVHRGSNKGVVLRYGKNITDIEQEESIENTITGIVPFWSGPVGDTNEIAYVYCDEKVIYCENHEQFPYSRVQLKDFSDEWSDPPTSAQLKEKAKSYISSEKIGIPKVNLTVSFVDLWNTSEYRDYVSLEEVKLCDTVTIIFEKLGISSTAEVIKTDYDVLKGRYNEIEVGEAKNNFSSTITTVATDAASAVVPDLPKDIVRLPQLNDAVDKATSNITGNNGGYVAIHDSNGDGEPDEILVMDTNDISTAQNVWRWNKEGLGHSSTGYNGTYESAMTADGKIVANSIYAGPTTILQMLNNKDEEISKALKTASDAVNAAANATEIANNAAEDAKREAHDAAVAASASEVSKNLAEFIALSTKIENRFTGFETDNDGVHIRFANPNTGDEGEIYMDGASIYFRINGQDQSWINTKGFNFDYGILTTALSIGKENPLPGDNEMPGSWIWTKSDTGHFRLMRRGG